MGKTWSDVAVRNLTNWAVCPRCDFSPLSGGWCPRCETDLNGPVAVELAAASRAAVEALETRQEILDRLPRVKRAVENPVTAPPAYAAPLQTAPTLPARPESQVSVQSVLAVAGAGLFAIAAIVFTFFNEALADITTRSIVVGIISVVFLGAAWLLARSRLQFSAEAVGALAMVFVLLDVWAISTTEHAGVSDYAVAAVVTVIASALMIGLARIRRLRTWLWSGFVGLAITPVLFGAAVGTAWGFTLGWLAVGFVALGIHELARRLAPSFDSPLRFDHGTLIALQFLAVLWSLVAMLGLPSSSDAERILGMSAVLAGVALLSLLSTRYGLPSVWSFLAGGFATTAVAILPFAGVYFDNEWIIALAPAAAAGALAIIATLSRLGSTAEKPVLRRGALLAGSLSVTAVAVLPAAFAAIFQLLGFGQFWGEGTTAMAAILGGTAVAVAVAIVALARRSSLFATIALCIGLFALVTLATWIGFSEITRLAVSLALAVVLVPVLTSTPWLRSARLRYRIPLYVAAHVLVLEAAAFTQGEVLQGIIGGVAVVLAIAAITLAMPRKAQPFYAAAAFAYALGVFFYSIDELTTLEFAGVLAWTATLAVIVSVAVTIVRSIPRSFWYAGLAVTAVPLILSVGSMLTGITGFVGIPTGTALVLLVALTLMHRDGLTRELRAASAGLIVPTLSIAVISIVAAAAQQSASPIILPIIAGLVAVTLPTTGLLGTLLISRGHSEQDAAAVRLLVEITALVTGAIAVLLTLLRSAAGFDTTFLVLVIIGLGAAATGQFVHRRYAWTVAFISFTGALWALLALNTVREIEPYILPPALAAALIGAVAVARGKNGLGFYSVGLAVAVATPLLVLARSGNGAGVIETRAYGLLAGAVVLVVAGFVLGRVRERSSTLAQLRTTQLARLRTATLFVGLGAASAGVVQAGRYGFGLDQSVYGSGELVIVPALVFSVIAAAIAIAAAVLLSRSPRLAASRWLYVPAMVYLVAGPITAFRHGHVYSWTLLVLMATLLAVMLVTVVTARTRAVSLPPVWATFTIATITGIAGWSEHTVFRVEAFSMTLGAALLAAGIIAWHSQRDDQPSITRWPIGYGGSWWLLAPGIIVILANSLMSTLTEPLTWRAILVIALALAAILVGNRLRLAAPFYLGIAALPLENLFVFAVQIGDKIEPTTWWITLASAGAVLLGLAVSSERKASGEGGVAARLRDLR